MQIQTLEWLLKVLGYFIYLEENNFITALFRKEERKLIMCNILSFCPKLEWYLCIHNLHLKTNRTLSASYFTNILSILYN